MMMAGMFAIGLGLAARQCWRAPRQAAISLRLACWLLLVSLLARMVSLSRAQRFLSRRAASSGVARGAGPRDTASGASSDPSPERLAQAIDAILRLDLPILRGGRCWKRALVLQRVLARQGVDCRVTFGVRRARDGALEGHAWLERDGRPFLEPKTEMETETYAATFSLTGAIEVMEAMDSSETTRAGIRRAGR
jgi:hypothetical protein